jgi:hypothetical protein
MRGYIHVPHTSTTSGPCKGHGKLGMTKQGARLAKGQQGQDRTQQVDLGSSGELVVLKTNLVNCV